MKKGPIPVYDHCSITNEQHAGGELLIERFGTYLEKHYSRLHRPHRHSFYHLVLFTKGAGSHTIDFVQFPVRLFQLYFMIPGQVHSWHFTGATDGYIINFSDRFLTALAQPADYLERFRFFSGDPNDCVVQLPAPVQDTTVQLFESMLAELHANKPMKQEAIQFELLRLFILAERSGVGSPQKKLPSQKYQLLKSFRRLIDKHYRTIKLPKEYADLLYVTPNHLNALCQDVLGKTAGELIRDRVLLEAKRLLTNADTSVAEIAYGLNFNDSSYFNRFFKKYEQVTPEEFRKKISQP